MVKLSPISERHPHFLHGDGNNPDQWIQMPEIVDGDIRLMKLSGCNVMLVGIFAWSALEPEETKFEVSWLDKIIDKLYEDGVNVILATPSGARPAWLAKKYPEVLRVQSNLVRNLYGGGHNYCYTSPVYRKKTIQIDSLLAQHYRNHPALIAWHISNEYCGECHCDLCQEAFRNWLKIKYNGDLDKLNHEWWTNFWNHKYSDWNEIESPAPNGENSIHGLSIDWKRFVTDQTVDFMKSEISAIKKFTPNIPVTTNLLQGSCRNLDYTKFAKELDVVSIDTYPAGHYEQPDWKTACNTAFTYDFIRALKDGKPFMLMESTPSMTKWMRTCKLKRPGMHMLSSLQAVAHGAVAEHCGHGVFQDVTEVGQVLKKLDSTTGTVTKANAAVIYDIENEWAQDSIYGLRNDLKNYKQEVLRHYQSLWKNSVSVDVISSEKDFSKYKLIVAPVLYMLKPDVARRMEHFVESGGMLVTTYYSGIVNENNLCFLEGFPSQLRKLLGIRSEEVDTLYDIEKNAVNINGQVYEADTYCDLIHSETAEIIGTYEKDFYAGRPALTVNKVGDGYAYYIAFRGEHVFLDDFYTKLVIENKLKSVDFPTPEGVNVQKRSDGINEYLFLMNFNPEPIDISLDRCYHEIFAECNIEGILHLNGYDIKILIDCH
ncbi:MAG: beta-galactosidase [Bacillota bacterium]|nr:beta-galactosidase [Bacillota bacterium]